MLTNVVSEGSKILNDYTNPGLNSQGNVLTNVTNYDGQVLNNDIQSERGNQVGKDTILTNFQPHGQNSQINFRQHGISNTRI